MAKNSAQARRASKSRESSEPVTLVSPIFNGVERPVTTAQLAIHLQVSTRTIANYREQRLIPYWRINSRNIRYRISDVERALSA
jgi:predicted DNA-binding transcriptional regulator YafY